MKYVFPSPIFYSSENWVLEKWIFLKPHSWWVQDPCLNRFLLILKPCSLLLSCLSKIWISAHKYFSFHIYIYIYISPGIPFVQWELLNQYMHVDEGPSLIFQLQWCCCHFSGFRLSWHFSSWVMNVVLLLTILALLNALKMFPSWLREVIYQNVSQN